MLKWIWHSHYYLLAFFKYDSKTTQRTDSEILLAQLTEHAKVPRFLNFNYKLQQSHV